MAGIIWEDCEDIKLIELVSLGKYTFQEMTAWMSNRTASALQSRSSILGLQNNYQWHQYEFDKNFFETPNNRNCFWAGWLAADGNFENYCGERYALRWSIHQQDIEMMELFKSDIKFTGPITKFTKKLKTGVLSPHAVIRINQVDIQKYHLYKWGMIPNKTYRLPPSILETLELKLAFIVGYINGDGCINYYKSKKGKENFCIKFTNSSLQILQWIKQIAEDFNFPKLKNKKKPIRKIGKTNCYEVVFNGLEAASLFKLLKTVHVPSLARKWENPEILEYIERILK